MMAARSDARDTELGPALLLIVLFACAVLIRFELSVTGDTWFCLAFGREVLEYGLPHTNDVTVVGAGTWWINAQWLGQVVWNRLHAFGGFQLCMLVEPLVEAMGLALAMLAARRSGASSLRMTMGVALGLCLLPKFADMRAQTWAWLLFGTAMWLIVQELTRESSRRLWLGVPLLVLWTNLHGSSIVGAALLGLAALTTIVRRSTQRGVVVERVAMGVGFVSATLVSPYWLPPYWVKMSTDAGPFIDWAPPTLTSAPVHLALAALTLVGVIATWKKLDRAFAVYLTAATVLSLFAVRYAIILAFVLVTFAPAMLDALLGPRTHKPRPRRIVGVVCGVCAVIAIVVGFVRVPSAIAQRWPAEAIELEYASGNVLTNEQLGDWLLFERPDLRQRVLFNVRAEVATYDDWARLADIERGEIHRIDEYPDVQHIVIEADAPAVEVLRSSDAWEERVTHALVAVFERKR